jgi:phenylacetate-CoA ligase
VQVRCELLPAATISQNEAQAWLTERIKTLVGITTQVSVEAPNSIERTLVGKARRVVDLRKN